MSIRSEIETVELRGRIEKLEAEISEIRGTLAEIERLIAAMSRQQRGGKAA